MFKKISVAYDVFENFAGGDLPFPLRNDTFNLSWDFFCAQHGTPYGRDNYPTGIGTSGKYTKADMQNGYTITGHKGDHTKVDGDIDTSVTYYLDKNGTLKYNSGASASPWKNIKEAERVEKGFTEEVVTNWVYVKTAYTFDCENGISTNAFKSGQNGISHGGFAFTLAVKQKKGTRNISYRDDPLQWMEWKWLGYGATYSSLEEIGKEYEKYHKKAEDTAKKINPLYIEPDEHVGTELSGNNYLVGPFTMSDYARLLDYSISGTNIPAGAYTETAVVDQAYINSLPASEAAEWTYIGNGQYRMKTRTDVNIPADNLQNMAFHPEHASYTASYRFQELTIGSALTQKSTI